MTVKQKVDLIANYLAYNFLYHQALQEKNEAIKKQDFEKAVKAREDENKIAVHLEEFGSQLIDLLKQKHSNN